jgi:hypothetical protein
MYMHFEITLDNSYSLKLDRSRTILPNSKPCECILVLVPEGKLVTTSFPSSTRTSVDPTKKTVLNTLLIVSL